MCNYSGQTTPITHQSHTVIYFTPDLHGGLVLARSFVWHERKTPSCSMIQGDTNTPQVNTDSIGFLLRLMQYSTLIHVWVLNTHTHTQRTQAGLQKVFRTYNPQFIYPCTTYQNFIVLLIYSVHAVFSSYTECISLLTTRGPTCTVITSSRVICI